MDKLLLALFAGMVAVSTFMGISGLDNPTIGTYFWFGQIPIWGFNFYMRLKIMAARRQLAELDARLRELR